MVPNGVKQMRVKLGMTLKQLSIKSGVPVSTIGHIEKGVEPKVTTAKNIARALDVRIEELW